MPHLQGMSGRIGQRKPLRIGVDARIQQRGDCRRNLAAQRPEHAKDQLRRAACPTHDPVPAAELRVGGVMVDVQDRNPRQRDQVVLLVQPAVLRRVEGGDQVAVAHIGGAGRLQAGVPHQVLEVTRHCARRQDQMRVLAQFRQRQPQRAQRRDGVSVGRHVADERNRMRARGARRRLPAARGPDRSPWIPENANSQCSSSITSVGSAQSTACRFAAARPPQRSSRDGPGCVSRAGARCARRGPWPPERRE